MDQVFRTRHFVPVPDGTEVSAFLNATDSTQPDLPIGALGDMSIAAGRIAPRTASGIHVHPLVSQVTYVVRGNLAICMQEPAAPRYRREYSPGEAALTRAGTLLQLLNEGDSPVEVLYMVSPSYVFEVDDGRVVYDDALLVAHSWDELERAPRVPLDIEALSAARAEAQRRIARAKATAQAGEITRSTDSRKVLNPMRS